MTFSSFMDIDSQDNLATLNSFSRKEELSSGLPSLVLWVFKERRSEGKKWGRRTNYSLGRGGGGAVTPLCLLPHLLHSFPLLLTRLCWETRTQQENQIHRGPIFICSNDFREQAHQQSRLERYWVNFSRCELIGELKKSTSSQRSKGKEALLVD